ncbi:hypothetical protein [Bradyrhizobium betae]|uniref:Uncharacterized protein n=1 Tax=Bradyrhizobium betae TaxID=244734 RepID=A0A5P6P3Y8_9BRAD|nr:hypothetical protein [Bradyrhizobium betae]MCS3728318.1 type IV secretory pathway VirB10-like protein [Bradyrhizobium betae]QFI73001.1 hypothetical protein F8237_11695 [Bradyrhizobium betae]
MRASTAYFVGAGTIVAAIAIGLGGGIVAGNIMNPIAPKQGPDTGKMAQRAEVAARPAMTNAPSERVQYITGSQTFGAIIAAPAQALDEARPEAKPDTQAIQANAEPQPSQAAAVEPPKPAPAAPPQIAKPAVQQAATEPPSSPENAYAKARDSDVKRTTSERRRIDRRERWAERSRYESREQRGMRDRTDWDDVARNVRADSDARDVPGRSRGPRIMLFGSDDD